MMRILGTLNPHVMAIRLSRDMKYRFIRKQDFTQVSVVIVLLEKHFLCRYRAAWFVINFQSLQHLYLAGE
jgi:hypothetical protein